MAIKNLIIYKGTNFSDYLYLPLRDYSSSQLAITNITGLEPVNSDINISDYAARDGGVFNSSRKGNRNIVATMKLFDKPTMDAVRNKVYYICPTGDPVTVVIDWEDGSSKLIHGYVESTPADYFGDQEGIQISIICPDPNFITVYRVESDEGLIYFKQYANGFLHKFGDSYSINEFSENELSDTDPQLYSEAVSGISEIAENDWIYYSDGNLPIRNAVLLLAFNVDQWQEGLYIVYVAVDDLLSLQMLGLTTIEYYDYVKRKSLYNYVLAEEGAEWVENQYYYYDEDSQEYVLITSEVEFNYRTIKYEALSEAVDFESNKYYELSNFPPALDKWILVSWDNPSILDDESTYGYPITYGFLSSPWVSLSDGFSASSVLVFKDLETPFTTKERAFNVLIKKGTPLTAAAEFEENKYYKIKQEWRWAGGFHGFVKTTDSDEIYFYDKNPEMYKYSNGEFDRSLPLYGFYNRIKEYAVTGTAYVSNMYYYRSNGEDIQVTSSSAPADWGIVAGKYYRYVSKFYSLTNYPGTSSDSDNTILGGRSRHDVILDYLTYKYTRFSSASIDYEPGVYYKLLGVAEAEFYGLYNLSNIPIYELVDGEIPEDWGTGYYYIRSKMAVSERPYTVYYNDHMFAMLQTTESIFEYELLTEEPSDWDTDYSNYYTVEKMSPADSNAKWIVAYFKSGEYSNYSLVYKLLTDEPSDWATGYMNYYTKSERDLSNIYLRNGYIDKLIMDSDVKSYYDINLENNYILGDENGLVEIYELKSTLDTYTPGKYYIKSGDNWIKVTSATEPDDFYYNNFKYYVKNTKKANYIPENTLIYYNPILQALEYDHDPNHYKLFLNDPEKWLNNIKAEITKQTRCASGNIKLERGSYVSYLLAYHSNRLIFPSGPVPFIRPYNNVREWNGLPWGSWLFFKARKTDGTLYTFSNDCQILTAMDAT